MTNTALAQVVAPPLANTIHLYEDKTRNHFGNFNSKKPVQPLYVVKVYWPLPVSTGGCRMSMIAWQCITVPCRLSSTDNRRSRVVLDRTKGNIIKEMSRGGNHGGLIGKKYTAHAYIMGINRIFTFISKINRCASKGVVPLRSDNR